MSHALITVAHAADVVKERPASILPTAVRWTTVLGSPPAGQPGFDTSHAYVPLRTGQMVAVALGDGAITWVTDRPTTFAPAPGKGAVYVANENTIHSIQVSDAAIQWQIHLDARVSAPLLWDTGWLIVGLESGEVIALRGENGEAVWRKSLASAIQLRPTIEGDRLFVALDDGRVVCLDLMTGQLVWQQTLGDRATGIVALEDSLFVGAKDSFFYCLSPVNGVERWRWRTGADTVGAPVLDDKNVYYVGFDNVLRALDRVSGVQRWRKALRTRPAFGPVMAGGVLIVSGLAPELRAYYGNDGADAGEFLSPSEVAAQPYITEHILSDLSDLVILTGDGRVLGLRRRTQPIELPLMFVPGTTAPVVEPVPVAPIEPQNLPLKPPPALQTPSAPPAQDTTTLSQIPVQH